MNGRQLTDAQISKALRAHLPDRAMAGLRKRILDAAETTGQQRALPSVIGALSDANPVVRQRSLLIAAALLVALALASVAAVGALQLFERDPVQDLSLEPPTASPSPTPTPLLWTEASLGEDWPAPVRSEPVEPAIVRPLEPGERRWVYTDPLGDTGSSIPWADIQRLDVDLGDGYAWHVGFGLTNPPPLVAPTERWIAYGVVVDTDRDGVPDLRFGVDNIPATAPGKDEHRAWITDLHTGRTVSAVGAPYGSVGETYFDTFYPPGFHFGGDTPGPPAVDALSGLRAPFYAWASMIEDGRVVATDYAPDAGWLDPAPR